MGWRAKPRTLIAVALAAGFIVSTVNGQGPVSPRFGAYPVAKIYRGSVKPPDFGNPGRFEGTDLRCFGGEASEYSGAHVNFAGHFVLSACTCGTGCHYLFMWDAVTGKFYQRVPPALLASDLTKRLACGRRGFFIKASGIWRKAHC